MLLCGAVPRKRLLQRHHSCLRRRRPRRREHVSVRRCGRGRGRRGGLIRDRHARHLRALHRAALQNGAGARCVQGRGVARRRSGARASPASQWGVPGSGRVPGRSACATWWRRGPRAASGPARGGVAGWRGGGAAGRHHAEFPAASSPAGRAAGGAPAGDPPPASGGTAAPRRRLTW
jgi:hypothetical protein